MSDYMPTKDADLIAWMNVFMTYAGTNMTALGLVAADMTALGSQFSAFNGTYGSANTAHQQAVTATQAKLAARRSAELAFRAMVRKLQANGTLSDIQRQGLGITVRDSRPSLLAAATLANATPRPLALVDNGRQLIHLVRYAQEGPPTRRAKPQGVRACEVRMLVLAKDAPVPDQAEAMKSLGMPTRSPYPVEFAPADAGKMAWYRLRWVDSANTPVGEWSRPVGAMIVG
jgi:hypothetical protein